MIDKISGVMSLSEHYSPQYNKHIYIFGEHHVPFHCSPKDMPIENFFEYILNQNEDKIIDIFVEVFYISKNIERKPSEDNVGGGLSNVIHKFWYCLQSNKDLCLYKNLRLHYSDIRVNLSITNSMDKIIKFYYSLFQNISEEYVNEQMIKLKEQFDILDYFLQNRDKFLQYIYTIPKIKKQFDNIDDINLIIKLKQFITDNVYNIKNVPFSYDNIFDYINQYTALESIIMDAYLLARLFKTFRDGKKVYNSVILAGDGHAVLYRNFLNKLNFDLVQTKRNKGNNLCLSIKEFNQPFFGGNEIKEELCNINNDELIILIQHNQIFCFSLEELSKNKILENDYYFFPNTSLYMLKLMFELITILRETNVYRIQGKTISILSRNDIINSINKGEDLYKIKPLREITFP